MGVTKTQLGYLLVVALTCAAYVVAQDEVKFKVDRYRSTICIWGGDGHYDLICGKGWIRGGDEYSKLFRGTTRVYADSREVLETFDGNKTNFTRVAITDNGPTLIDNYMFDGDKYDKEKVPVERTATVTNGSGLFFQVDFMNLKCVGGMSRLATSPESFGNNIEIEWEGDPHIHKIYKYKYRDICKLTLKWRIASDYEVYKFRIFDPDSEVEIYFNGSQAYTYFEIPTMINITAAANVSGNTMCLTIDHPDYGDDYICGGQSVESNISIMAAINKFNDSTTEKSLIANGSVGFDVDHTYIFSRADIDITGYNNTNYPVDVKVDIGNNGYDDIYFAGTLTGLNLENDKLNDGNTYYDLNFTTAGEQTLYVDYFGQHNATHVSFDFGTFLAPNQSFDFDASSIRMVDTGIRWLCYGSTGGYIDNTLYSIGGKCSSVDGVAGFDYNTTFNFDLDTEIWTTGSDVQTDIGQSACSVSNGTYIWVIGGGGSGTDVNTVYRFDGTTYTALSSASVNRSMAACVLDNNKIYVFGGYDEGSNELTTTEIFNLSDNTWYAATSMPAAKGGLMGSLFNSSHLAAWGGWLSGSSLNSKTYVYEISSNTWTDLSATNFRRGGGAGVNIKGEIYSISGWYTTYHKTIHKFNKVTLVWEEQPDQLPISMYLPPQSSIIINGTVFLFPTTIQGYGDELMKVHFTPKEPLISIGDQPSFWSFDKYWNGESVSSGDLSEDWNKYIAGNCNSGRCSVPINIYSGSASGINLSSLNVTSTIGTINLNQTAFDLNESTYGSKEIELATTANIWGNVTFSNLNSTFYGDANFTIIANYTGDSVTNSSTTRVLGLRYSNYTADFPYESSQLIFWLNSVNETNVTPIGQSSWMNGTTFNFTRLWDWDIDIGIGLNQSLDSCLDLMVDNDTDEFIMTNSLQTMITTKPNSTRAWGINYRLNASSCNRTALGVYNFYPWFDTCCQECFPCW